MNRTLMTGLLAATLAAACTTGADPAPDEASEFADTTECTGAEVAPATLDGEVIVPADGADVRVRVTNQGPTERIVRTTLHGHFGSRLPAAAGAPVTIAPGQSVELTFALAELGVERDVLRLPVRLKAEIEAIDDQGLPLERTFARADVGPALPQGTAASQMLALPADAFVLADDPDADVTLVGIVDGGSGAALEDSGDPVDADGAPLADEPYADAMRFADDAPTSIEAITRAKTYNFCLRWPVSLADAGFGEDYGTSPTDPWRARGGRTVIYSHGVKYFDGYLDSSGCTGNFNSAYEDGFVIFGYSYALVAGNYVRVYNDAKQTGSMVIWGANAGTSGTKYYNFPDHELSNLLAVTTYTASRFNGGKTGLTFRVNRACRPGGCCDCASGGEIWVTNDDNKFLISHEYGHRILAEWIGSYNNDCSYDFSDNSTFVNPPCDTSTGHSMWSDEYNSCAAMEGWAHFVATDVYNNDSEGDNPGATMRYWSGSTINVENGPTGGVTRYFENTCIANTANRGVELDWLRQWWDYHSNDSVADSGSAPSHARMMNELDEAAAWNRDNVYPTIADGIEDYSGASQRDRWEEMGAWNGID